MTRRLRVCLTGTGAEDRGGAGRVLFRTVRKLDRERVEPIVLLPSSGPMVRELNEMGVQHELWQGGFHELRSVSSYAIDVARAARMFRRLKLDLLQTHNSMYWRPAEILAARVLRIPIVTHYNVVQKAPGPAE